MEIWIAFISGMFIGGFLGIVAISLCTISKITDEKISRALTKES